MAYSTLTSSDLEEKSCRLSAISVIYDIWETLYHDVLNYLHPPTTIPSERLPHEESASPGVASPLELKDDSSNVQILAFKLNECIELQGCSQALPWLAEEAGAENGAKARPCNPRLEYGLSLVACCLILAILIYL